MGLPSAHRIASPATTGCSTAETSAMLSAGKTKSVVAAERSRATSIGTCSLDMPRVQALPPRLRAARPRTVCPLYERSW